jgi:hypothetical protein
MNVVCLKMSNGDELIGRKVTRFSGGHTYSHVMQVFVQQGPDGRMGMGMMPYMHTIKGDEILLNSDHIIAVGDVDTDIEKNYLQRTSGIALS